MTLHVVNIEKITFKGKRYPKLRLPNVDSGVKSKSFHVCLDLKYEHDLHGSEK